MKKLSYLLQKYLLYAFPATLIVEIWGTITPEKIVLQNPSKLFHFFRKFYLGILFFGFSR